MGGGVVFGGEWSTSTCFSSSSLVGGFGWVGVKSVGVLCEVETVSAEWGLKVGTLGTKLSALTGLSLLLAFIE